MINDLTKGNPAKVIFIYSLPIILGNVFQQVYNFVDNIIVGRFVSYQALAGVGVTNGMTFLMLGIIFLNAALASFPSDYIAGFSAASRTISLGNLVPVSFGVAMANYAGQNFGAGRIDRMRQGVRATIVMSMLVCGDREDLLASDGRSRGTALKGYHLIHPAETIRLYRCHLCRLPFMGSRMPDPEYLLLFHNFPQIQNRRLPIGKRLLSRF